MNNDERIEAKLKTLCLSMCGDIEGSEIPFDQKVDAFKAVANVYAMLMKVKPPNPEPNGNFNGWHQQIKERAASGGRGRDPAPSIVSEDGEPEF